MSMFEDMSREMSSAGDGILTLKFWREGTGLIGFLPSDLDVEVPASWACASWDCRMRWPGSW